jgi:hypothetical protein
MQEMKGRVKIGAIALAVCMAFSGVALHAAAAQAEEQEAQRHEGFFSAVWEWIEGVFGGEKDADEADEADSAKKADLFASLHKNGFEEKDGLLYHYTDGQLDEYPNGFITIEDAIYHVSTEGSAIDYYKAGMATVHGILCHVSADGGGFDIYPAGFATIDGKLYHVSKEGYAIDQYEQGFCEIDGEMYYAQEDGSFLTDGTVGYLYFGEDGRYTSGDAELDGYVNAAIQQFVTPDMTKEQKLRAAYLYVRDHGAYLARAHQARGTTDWALESALFMFQHKKGNCYCFAGQFLYLARRLGYEDAYVVSGGVGRKDSDHAWVMIPENGKSYIYDVELEWGYRVGKYGKAEYNMYKMPLNKTVFSYQFP